ncbi:16S rRNA methyltransferase [Erythrobacter longus]|uniref:Ribosomal RNA small subunit methyltransferase G n=1 Tax=Erythrobacter longus TaxID=1044 RepID=A0A074M482_ERYLO|nr:16S rRNA (guanine(527)-N(7))-methyltransferase RsmG [Erythrobacter longus]KEO89461.1 16S rRNA methyltransferase [Erythrobacter longus]
MSDRRLLTSETEARSYVESLASQEAWEGLNRYASLLLEENQRQNLISKPSEASLWLRHIADSAQLLEHAGLNAPSQNTDGPWLDLGSGPGLPGLIISILSPELPVVLVESRARRVEFLERCISEMGLNNCTVRGDRLERIDPFHAGIISARAFAPLEKLLSLSAPFSTKHTRYLLPKGRSAAHELKRVKAPIRKMFHVKHSLTDADAGIIVSK